MSSLIENANPSREVIPIFLASDENFAPYLAVTIASICENTASFCRFHVLDGGIVEDSRRKIQLLSTQYENCAIEFIGVESNAHFAGFKIDAAHSVAMYYRFLIADIASQYDKVIYLDCDLLVMLDIAELYHEPMNGFPIGAVEDRMNTYRNYVAHVGEYLQKIGLNQEHMYFNSGVLLLDLKLWREMNVGKSLLNIAMNRSDQFQYPDQDVLNIYCSTNRYCLLKLRYNWMISRSYLVKSEDDCIFHFVAPFKPWKIPPTMNTSLIDRHQLYWSYLRKTAFYDAVLRSIDEKKLPKLFRSLQYVKALVKS